MDDGPTPVGAVLDRIPLGRHHRRLLVLTGSAWALAAVEVLLVSFTLPAMSRTWGLTGTQAGVIGSASLLGMVVGSWSGGRLADRRGRVVAFQATVLVYALAAGLTALAVGFYTAVACRVLTGVGIGGTATVATAYLSEHLPTSGRGRYLVYLDAFWSIGTVVAVVAAWAFLSDRGDVLLGATVVPGWRLLFVAAATPVLLVPLLGSLEETPFYLVTTGRAEEASERVRAIARTNGTPIDLTGIALTARTHGSAGVRALFAPDTLASTATASVAWFGANFGFYGVFIWLPAALGAAELVGGPYRYLLLAGLVQVPGYLSAAYLVDRIGPRRTLGAYLLLSGVATCVFAVTVSGATAAGVGAFRPFVLGLLAASFFSVGSFGALRAYTPELFPTAIRSTATGFAEGNGRIAGILGPVVAGALVSGGYVVALTPLAVAFALGGLVVLLFGIETRGQSLE